MDANGDTLDILVQTRRNARAARRFLTRLIARFGQPRVVITDKLRSYLAPIRKLAPGADHWAHRGLNNRIEGSHGQPVGGKRSWGDSNPIARRKDSSPPTIRSTTPSVPDAIVSPLPHTAMPEPMLSAGGMTKRSR
ncbi:hypothetical protein KU6B_57860 (plasmid) [Mameliella alba]|nr:hypothetical protein KU6B_57860 [Mameliella alba]